MFGKEFQRKYALTDQGIRNTRQATFWTVVVNLTVMGGMGILYRMMSLYMETLTKEAPLPGAAVFLLLVLAFILLSFFTHMQQYRATYGLVYGEVKSVRLSLAERMRKLPLGYFGKRDLADLTETIMGDVNRLEHVWSHCLGYLYGSYISTAIVGVMLFAIDWRLSIARALLKNAPIVLLDEATASLDVENETKVQEALSRLLAGKTVLVIGHRMRTVEAADKVVVLVDGQVAEEGNPEELLKKPDGFFKRMAELQSDSAGWGTTCADPVLTQ